MAAEPNRPIGLIAGKGRCPFLAADGMRKAGRRVIIAGLRGQASPKLIDQADTFRWVGLLRMGSWISTLRKHGVSEAVMVGSVDKKLLHKRFGFLRLVPDFRTLRLYFGKVRKDKRDSAMLLATADELSSEGIELVSSVKYCSEHLAGEGVMTAGSISMSLQEDVDFGWRIARASADLDIGQSIAVKKCDILAIEAIEGTDAMIARAGKLCPAGGWTMIKVARENQDMRFDVPTVGLETIHNLKKAKCSCLVLEAGKTLIVDKAETLTLANKLGITVVGIRSND
ncbi:MAG TPA: LpxI family protein [Phycisphaerae bacterium]|nr:LpxI family protein [Phycisphaerae bacterium]